MYLEIGFLNSSLQFSARSVFIVMNIEDWASELLQTYQSRSAYL